MRARSNLLIVVIAAACGTHQDTMGPTSTNPPVVIDPSGNIRNVLIVVNISGDKTTGSATYAVNLDGSPWAQLVPGENLFTVSPGLHRFTFTRPSGDLFPQWCSLTSPSSFSTDVTAEFLTTITYNFDCPALVGTGILALTVKTQSSIAPENIPVTFTRINGPTVTQSVTVLLNVTASIVLPVGLYRVNFQRSQRCTPPTAYQYIAPQVAIRNSILPLTSPTLSATYQCT